MSLGIPALTCAWELPVPLWEAVGNLGVGRECQACAIYYHSEQYCLEHLAPIHEPFHWQKCLFSERTKLAALAKVDFLLQHLRKKQTVLQCTLRMSLLIELYSSPDKSHAAPSLMETIHGICIIYDLDSSTHPWPSWGKGQFCHNKDGSSSWQGLVRGECIWCQIWAWFKSSNANNWWKMFAFVPFEKKKWTH